MIDEHIGGEGMLKFLAADNQRTVIARGKLQHLLDAAEVVEVDIHNLAARYGENQVLTAGELAQHLGHIENIRGEVVLYISERGKLAGGEGILGLHVDRAHIFLCRRPDVALADIPVSDASLLEVEIAHLGVYDDELEEIWLLLAVNEALKLLIIAAVAHLDEQVAADGIEIEMLEAHLLEGAAEGVSLIGVEIRLTDTRLKGDAAIACLAAQGRILEDIARAQVGGILVLGRVLIQRVAQREQEIAEYLLVCRLGQLVDIFVVGKVEQLALYRLRGARGEHEQLGARLDVGAVQCVGGKLSHCRRLLGSGTGVYLHKFREELRVGERLVGGVLVNVEQHTHDACADSLLLVGELFLALGTCGFLRRLSRSLLAQLA